MHPDQPTGPPVVVSACLRGVPCRWDGKARTDPDAASMGEVVSLCPEELGGLPTPRPPAEIVGGDGDDVLDGSARVVTDDGEDVTEQYVRGAQRALAAALAAGAKRAVLQAMSPTCGCGQIYDGTFRGRRAAGDGVFAALLRRHGIEVTAVAGERASTSGPTD